MTRQREQKSWDAFSKAFDPRQLKPFRIENLYSGSGMPDVLLINRRGTVFWIENKAIENWPVRATTKPLRDAFEPGQLGFQRQWREWHGIAFTLLRVGLDYYLLDPDEPLDEMTREELVELAVIQHGKTEIATYLENLK
jgi:hypothetical protein